MIDRQALADRMTMDTPKCTGAVVIGAILALAVIRYLFEGRN